MPAPLSLNVLEHLKPFMEAVQDPKGRQGPDSPGELEARLSRPGQSQSQSHDKKGQAVQKEDDNNIFN